MLRLQQLNDWLNTVLKSAAFSLAPASADASFRRYFRVKLDNRTLIAMDAPPLQEGCTSFVHVAEVFANAGLNVPRILEKDLGQGFLLLTDLGDTTFLDALKQSASNGEPNNKTADGLYRDACMALVKLQSASKKGVFPDYDEALLLREMQLFPDWYVAKHLQLELGDVQKKVLNDIFAILNQNILAQGQVYVHRDYHSRNLMLCTDAQGSNPGILDFQDAVYGAITYDLVSLLKDAYISWDEEQVIDRAVRYWQAAKKANLPVPQDFSEFYRDFEWMGAQRHLKILGIFARLYYRDGKDGYLKDMPLVMDYLRKVCERYVELRPMLRLLNELAGRTPQVGYTF
ncbi:MAG TPA: phosphotransferase [Methylophilaceae bacterium]|nr:phosphotransferase [Methylophilaceae bacterium]